MKKIYTVALVFFLFVVVLSVASPIVLKEYFNRNSRELVGRKAVLKSIYFNPLNCSLSAQNLTIYEENDSAIFTGFRDFYVNINFIKLFSGQFQIEEVRLDSPFVNIINNYGIFNFNDLIPQKDSTIVPEQEEVSGNFEFEIVNMRMNNGNVVYFEKEIDHHILMNDLSFSLPRFAYNSQSANMDLQFVIDDSGLLAMKNKYYPDESRFVSQIKLNNLNIALAKPYTREYVNITDINGKANCDISIQGIFKEKTEIIIEGTSWLNELEIMDSVDTPLFKADSIGVDIRNIDVFNNRYSMKEVYVRNMFMRFDMMDSSNNMYQVFAPMLEVDTTQLSETDSLETAMPVYYSIDTIMVFNSTIKYRDFSLENYFEYDITNIIALADNISSTNNKAKFSSTGLLNQQGRYNANLVFDPNNPLNFDLDFAIKGFQMTDLSPFTLTYAGHPIFEGELVYAGNTVVQQGIMESENKITIYNFKVGEKVSKNVLYAIPLKFAVFLLKDKDGVVNLNLPMDGNINDPNFKIGPLVWQVIRYNLLKVVATPGKLLASQFGMNEEDIQYLPFEGTDTLLVEQTTNSLLKLQELTDNKPGLLIELAYYSPFDQDILHLALQETKTAYVVEKFNPKTEEKLSALINNTADNDIHFTTYLKNNVYKQDIPADSLAIEWVGMEKLISDATILKIKRKESIQDYFRQVDSLYLQKFLFTEILEPPKFPVEKSGFVISFDME